MSNLKREIVHELHKPARKNFPRRRVVVRGIDELWQIDLVEMGSIAAQNQNFKYILTVIDCFSKFAFAIALKDKTGKSTTNAMQNLFQTKGRVPQKIQTDQGKEFYNSSFSALMKRHNIHHYSTHSHMKASVDTYEHIDKHIDTHTCTQRKLFYSFSFIDSLGFNR
jgi:transposase InsO family protein